MTAVLRGHGFELYDVPKMRIEREVLKTTSKKALANRMCMRLVPNTVLQSRIVYRIQNSFHAQFAGPCLVGVELILT